MEETTIMPELESLATGNRQVALECATALFCAGSPGLRKIEVALVLQLAEEFESWLEQP